MNAAKKALARSTQFVSDHKVPLAIVATAAATVAVMRKLQGSALTEAYEFIDAAGLTEKFLDSTPFDI